MPVTIKLTHFKSLIISKSRILQEKIDVEHNMQEILSEEKLPGAT